MALLLVALVYPLMSVRIHGSIRNSPRNGIDLSVIDVSIEYSNPSDEFSTKCSHPIIQSLFTGLKHMLSTDGYRVTVRNDGNSLWHHYTGFVDPS